MSSQQVEPAKNYKGKILISSICAAGLATALYFFFRKNKKTRKKERSFIQGEENSIVSNKSKNKRNNEFVITSNVTLTLNTNTLDTASIVKVDQHNYSPSKKGLAKDDSESKLSDLKSNLYRKQFKQIKERPGEDPKPKKRRTKEQLNIKEKEYNLSKLSLKNSYVYDGKHDDNNNFQYKQFLLELEEEGRFDQGGNFQESRVMFESDGYIEEDEDLQEKVKIDMLSDNFTVTSKPDHKFSQKLVIDQDKIIIQNEEELREVLFGKTKYKDFSCTLKLVERLINENEKVYVIKEKELLVLLAYLFKDLHPGLIELGDNFVEERRKYFKVDNDTYVNIINYFLRKKEEFFLCVLSDLMSKLNISQKVLDNTFYYYMNVADNTLKEVQMIKSAYDKVYHAGLKYSIAPKNLTKNRLKKVLEYQCETYENLLKKNPTYEPDVIEIMVTDHVYLEFGLDREAIKAAIKKHNVSQDYNFENVIVKLENFQNNSFINI